MKYFQLIALFCLVAAISAKSFRPRIINGQDAKPGLYPYAVAINARTPTTTMFCGGTLISDQWIMTAGQCVKDVVQFAIQMGSTDLTGDDPNRVSVNASTYVLHPEYNATNLANDIGLVKLDEPVAFTEYIKAANLSLSDIGPSFRNDAIGWGKTSDAQNGTTNKLQTAPVYTLSNDDCKLVYGAQVQDTMLCAKGFNNEGTCFEDTGSPLVTVMVVFHWIVGISSFVSGNGCESTDPSGFTRVVPYKDWIRNVTAMG